MVIGPVRLTKRTKLAPKVKLALTSSTVVYLFESLYDSAVSSDAHFMKLDEDAAITECDLILVINSGLSVLSSHYHKIGNVFLCLCGTPLYQLFCFAGRYCGVTNPKAK